VRQGKNSRTPQVSNYTPWCSLQDCIIDHAEKLNSRKPPSYAQLSHWSVPYDRVINNWLEPHQRIMFPTSSRIELMVPQKLPHTGVFKVREVSILMILIRQQPLLPVPAVPTFPKLPCNLHWNPRTPLNLKKSTRLKRRSRTSSPRRSRYRLVLLIKCRFSSRRWSRIK
jgi:hypothetical protein